MAYPTKNWDSLIKKRTPHDIKWPSICQWFIGCSLERDLVSRCVWTTNAFYHSRAFLNMAWRFITTQDGWQLSRVQKHCKLHVGKAELNTSCSYRWVQLTLLNHSQPLIHCILLLLVSNSVYIYMCIYIYIVYIYILYIYIVLYVYVYILYVYILYVYIYMYINIYCIHIYIYIVYIYLYTIN